MEGILCAFVGATLWGLSGVCSDFLMAQYGASPLFVTMVRAIGAGVLFAGVIAVRYRDVVARMLADRQVLRQLLIFGVVGLFPCQIVYLIAIDLTNAGTATVFQSLNIVFIALFTCAVKGALPNRNEALAVVLAFCSVFVIATQGNPLVLSMSLASLLWCLFLGVVESFYVVYPAELFQRFGSFAPTGIAMGISGLLSLGLWLVVCGTDGSLASGAAVPALDALGVIALATVAVLGTFGAFALFLHGVSLAGPVTGSLMGAMEPVSAAVLSALMLATPFSGWDWLGLVLMVAVFFLVTFKPGRLRARKGHRRG